MKKESNVADSKEKQLEIALATIEKKFGKGTIRKLGDSDVDEVPVIPTGIPSLDYALGVGGVPRGRVIEIYGPEASGKTTIALSIVAQAQKMGGQAAYIDAEHALDPEYARIIGVDTDNLYISQPDTGEQALEVVDTLVRSSALDVIVVDSVAALVPKDEIDRSMGDPHMAMQARLMSQALRKLVPSIHKSQTCVIFINQIRMKIGQMFGNPETTTGGLALKFHASVRIEVRSSSSDRLKKGNDIYGTRVRFKVVKNKVAPPHKDGMFEIIFNKGINAISSMFDLALLKGIIRKSGAWFYIGEERIGQGKENAIEFITKNKNLLEKIEREVFPNRYKNKKIPEEENDNNTNKGNK